LREEDGGSVLDSVLFEGFGAFFGIDGEILDILELSEEGYGGGKVVLELQRGLIPVGVEEENQQLAEIVEERASEHLVGLELYHF
jgi:hypothetical protein